MYAFPRLHLPERVIITMILFPGVGLHVRLSPPPSPRKSYYYYDSIPRCRAPCTPFPASISQRELLRQPRQQEWPRTTFTVCLSSRKLVLTRCPAAASAKSLGPVIFGCPSCHGYTTVLDLLLLRPTPESCSNFKASLDIEGSEASTFHLCFNIPSQLVEYLSASRLSLS